MANTFISEEVNIFELPTSNDAYRVISPAGTQSQVTIGDLHGNSMKLIFMLVKHGIVTNMAAENYRALVELYRTSVKKLTKNDLDSFHSILASLTFNNSILVRLIGDELADRGSNDYFTLKILEKLHQHHVPVEITVSNHSFEFIQAYERRIDFQPFILNGPFVSSLLNLNFLVTNNIISRQEILELTAKSYKHYLRAISYSLNQDKTEITIYSHAGIGLNTIKYLAIKLEVTYDDSTTSKLAETIDNINSAFQERVQTNNVSDPDNLPATLDPTTHPLEFIMYNRCYDNLDRPSEQHNYQLNYVHGHDSNEPTSGHIYNLDNLLGKSMEYHIGEYTALYSHRCIPARVFRLKESDVRTEKATESPVQATSFFNSARTASLKGAGIGVLVWGGVAVAVILSLSQTLTFILIVSAIAALLTAVTILATQKLLSPTPKAI